MEVQNRVRELMARKSRIEDRRITLQIVVEETGLSMSSVTNWATNSITRFDAKQIVTFCEYFNCGIGELLVLETGDSEISPEIESLLTIAV